MSLVKKNVILSFPLPRNELADRLECLALEVESAMERHQAILRPSDIGRLKTIRAEMKAAARHLKKPRTPIKEFVLQ